MMTAKKQLLTALLLVPGCSLYVQGELDKAAVNVVGSGGEGEGEGGVEGEGEGGEEGEGEEGEGEVDDDDPACEEEERLLVVRANVDDVLQVYDMTRTLLRRFPEGNDENVTLANDDENAINNGYEATSVALGSDDRLYLVGSRFLYLFRKSTLLQRELSAGPQLTLDGFGSYHGVQVLGGHVVASGSDVSVRDEDASLGTPATSLHRGDNYGRSVAFTVSDVRHVAVTGEHGYAIATDTGPGGAPAIGTVVDTEFDTDRVNSFGGGATRKKGIAFDQTTNTLLIGDLGHVIIAKETDGFDIEQNDGSGDFAIPDSDSVEVQGIAARGGFAWVLLGRSNDNLYKLDLSTSPPTVVDIGEVNTGGFGDAITVGCRRVVVAGFNGVFAVNRDGLGAAGTLGLRDVNDVKIVRRLDLGLAGDDGT